MEKIGIFCGQNGGHQVSFFIPELKHRAIDSAMSIGKIEIWQKYSGNWSEAETLAVQGMAYGRNNLSRHFSGLDFSMTDVLTHQLINSSTHQPIDPSTHQPIDPSTHRPINPKTYKLIDLSTHQLINLSTNQPINPSTYRPINPQTFNVTRPEKSLLNSRMAPLGVKYGQNGMHFFMPRFGRRKG